MFPLPIKKERSALPASPSFSFKPSSNMQARLTAGRWTMGVGSSTNRIWKHEQRRSVAGKTSNRAAVHGTKLPASETMNEEVEMEINKGKEKKEKKREEIEKTVEYQFPTQPPQESDSPTK